MRLIGAVLTALATLLPASIHAAGTSAGAQVQAALERNAGAPRDSQRPPLLVILKFDDLREVDGLMPPGWRRLMDYLKEAGIKAAIGIVADSLANPTPDYLQWIQSQYAQGLVEFWLHGWDHLSYTRDGVRYNEFVRPYQAQAERLARSQRLARQKLGFSFTTFGPPGGPGKGSFNADTLRLLAADPDLRVMLYPTRLDEAGRAAMAMSSGKLTIFDRSQGVDLESPIGVPNFDQIRRGIDRHAQRDYFVLQGHPARWDAARFNEFERIVRYLIARGAVFTTPAELAAQRRPSAPRAALNHPPAPD